jgi:copper transport protein
VLALATLVIGAQPAAAHAALASSDPRNGAVLPTSPSRVVLTFNEPISLQPGGIRVFQGDGTPVRLSATARDNTAAISFEGELASGTYVVSWRVNSADGHAISGAFNFSVVRTSEITFTPAERDPSAALTVALQAVNALTYAGLLLATGLALFSRYVMPAAATSLARTRHRVSTIGTWAAGAAVLGTVASVPLQAAWQAAGTVTTLAETEPWAALTSWSALAPALMVAAGLGLVLWGQRRSPTEGSRDLVSAALVVGGTGVALASMALVGHTRSYGPAWVSYPLDVMHVGAAALWLGTLAGVAVACHRSSRARAIDVAETVSRFSSIAVETILALSVAGMILAFLIVDSLPALVESAWGITFLVKVALVALILGLAAANRYLLLPTVQSRPTDEAAWVRLRGLLRVEAGALAAVVAVTGVLVTRSPLIDAEAAPVPQPRTVREETPVSGGRVVLRVNPVQRGTNTVTLTFLTTSGEALEPVETPHLETTYQDLALGPFDQQLTELGPGRYTATVDLGFSGTWLLDVTARLGKYTSASPRLAVDIP